MVKKNSFDEKIAKLQQEAISRDKRIVLVEKGKKRQSLNPNTSVGKQYKGIKKKRISGQGVYYSETKERIALSLTPTAKASLDDLAEDANLSRSEVLERCLRTLKKFPKFKSLVLEYITDHRE